MLAASDLTLLTAWMKKNVYIQMYVCMFIYIYISGFFSGGGLLLGRISISMIPGSSTQSISFISIDGFLFFWVKYFGWPVSFPKCMAPETATQICSKKGKIHPIIQSLCAFALAVVSSRCQRRTVWVKVNVAEPTLEGLMDIVPWAPQWKDTVVASVQCRHRWLGRAGFLDARFVFWRIRW